MKKHKPTSQLLKKQRHAANKKGDMGKQRCGNKEIRIHEPMNFPCVLSYVYTLRLIGPISYLDACYIRIYE